MPYIGGEELLRFEKLLPPEIALCFVLTEENTMGFSL
jgi:hypothetical protein